MGSSLVSLLSVLLVGAPAGAVTPEPTDAAPTAGTDESSADEPGSTEPEPEAGRVPESPTLPEPPVVTPEPPVVTPEPPATELRWDAPADCPTVDELRATIERRMGRRLRVDELRIDGTIRADAGGLHRLSLRITTEQLDEQRSLEATSCTALTDAAALMIALALDPVSVAQTIGPMPSDDASRSGASESSPTRKPVPGPPARGFDGVGLRASAGLGLGALPGLTGVPSLAAGVRWARARIEVEGSYWIPRRTESRDGASVDVQLGTATVRGCGQLRRGDVEAPLCGGVQLGGMRGAGTGAGLADARASTGLVLAIEAGMGLSWWFRPRWALAGGFVAAVPLLQPSFEQAGDPPVVLFEPAAISGRLWLGVELRLGARRPE